MWRLKERETQIDADFKDLKETRLLTAFQL